MSAVPVGTVTSHVDEGPQPQDVFSRCFIFLGHRVMPRGSVRPGTASAFTRALTFHFRHPPLACSWGTQAPQDLVRVRDPLLVEETFGRGSYLTHRNIQPFSLTLQLGGEL